MVNNNNNNNRVSGSSFLSDDEFVVIRLGGQSAVQQKPGYATALDPPQHGRHLNKYIFRSGINAGNRVLPSIANI